MDQEGRDYTVKRGNKVISLSKEENARWAEKVKPLLNDYVNSMKAKGLPGAEASAVLHGLCKGKSEVKGENTVA